MIRLLPVYLQDTRRCQQYFTDMSSKGYHLKKVWLPFAIFEKGEPMEYEYRIRPLAVFRIYKPFAFNMHSALVDSLDKNKFDEFCEAGAKLVGKHLNTYIFRYVKGSIEGEIPVDAAEKERIKNLIYNNDVFRMNLGGFLGTLFMSVIMLSDMGFIYSLLYDLITLLFYVLCVRLLIGLLRKARLKMQINQEMNMPLDEIESWESRKMKARAVNWFLRILFIALLAVFIIPEKYGDYQSLKTEPQYMPIEILQLSDIEDIGDNDEIIYNSQDNDYNRVRFFESLLAPHSYELEENYSIKGDDGTLRDAELYIEYYQMRNERMAFSLFETYRYKSPYDNISSYFCYDSDVFEKVGVITASGGTYFLLLNDNELLKIIYDGDKSPEEVLAAAEEVYR